MTKVSFKKRKAPLIKLDTNGIKNKDISYKNPEILKKFMDARYKIYPRKVTRLSASVQRTLQKEIKKSRMVALLPYTDRHAL